MRNTQKKFKVFLDTSVLLSGLNSPLGASGIIISLFKLKKIQVIISPEVIFETKRVIENKFPLLKTAFYDFLLSKPIITNKATKKDIRNAYKIIQTEDAPILAGALKTKIDFLLTLDKKFIKLVKGKVNFEILSPGEFLQKYRDKINQN
jgi:putative PIN family toxin of toxin-antitoxin system